MEQNNRFTDYWKNKKMDDLPLTFVQDPIKIVINK